MRKIIATIVITMIMTMMTDGNQMMTMMSWPERQEPRPLVSSGDDDVYTTIVIMSVFNWL